LLNQPAQKKIFCFPPGGGLGIAYQLLANIINDYSFYSFNFIENEDRLTKYVEIITNIQETGPYMLFGWSAAGKLIFEVAGALESQGFEVSDVILVDCFVNKRELKDISDETKENKNGLNEFIDNIEKHMDEYGIGYFKEKVRQRVKLYSEYLWNSNQIDVIHANIHLIISETAQNEAKDCHCWEKLTTKKNVIYNGFGEHKLMFSKGPVEKNAKIIRKILRHIESERNHKITSAT
jgi:thioesterase domain-containing protein